MLRAGQLLPPKGLSTLRFSTGRFPPAPAACYRASWQLPGPDFHRLADTSLRVNHLNVTTSWSSLCTHAAGHTKLGLGPVHGGRARGRELGTGAGQRHIVGAEHICGREDAVTVGTSRASTM